ncbi:MAG: twin-arginine translocase TatA/TatE family subunit [Akkermansia sp.]|nr:twin-arginine translocase TatA/TatE family subunit [Akkermansia sp.]
MQVVAQLGSPSQWLILIIICLVIFGAKRLPDIARNLGKGVASFKKAKREFEQELLAADKEEKQQQADSQPSAESQDK